ncbi:MAG: hypothetical protein Q9195_006173 [Heterodermia aff. obscurata]
MPSECSADRPSAPASGTSGAGKKRSTPTDFTTPEPAKRRQNIPKDNENQNTTDPHHLHSHLIEPDSPAFANPPVSANPLRRFSLNDGSRQNVFSPLTRSGTGLVSPIIETDTTIRGRASEPLRKYDSYRPPYASLRPDTATREVERTLPADISSVCPDSRPYLSDTAGMEGSLRSENDTRQDPGPNEDGPTKPAAVGALSESSTPGVAITSRDSEGPNLPTNVSDMSRSLAKTFSVYAKGIVNTSQSISQNKAAKTRLRRSRKADEKLQGRYSDFAALEEMQSKSLVSSEKKSSKCDKALSAAKKSQKNATIQIANVLAQSAYSTPSRSSEPQGAKLTTEAECSSLTIERIKADMTRLRGDFEKLALHAQRADFVVGKQNRLENEFVDFSTRLEKQTDRLDRDKVSFSAVRAYDQDSAKLKLLVSKAEAIIAKLEKPEERAETINKNFDFADRFDGLQAKIKILETTRLDDRVQALESQIEPLGSIKYDVEKARLDSEVVGKDLKDQIISLQALRTMSETRDMQFTELKRDLSVQTGDVRRISEVVYGGGDSNEASLLDIIQDSQNDADKFRKMFNTLNTTMDEHQARIDDLEARLKGSKDNLATSSANPTIADSGLEGALVDIDQLKQEIARLDKEQVLKDDIVDEEMSRLDNQVISRDDILEKLCDRFNELQSKNTTHEDEPIFERQSMQEIKERLDEINEKLARQGDSSLKNLEDIKALNIQLHELSSKAIDSRPPPDDTEHLHGLLTEHRGQITDLIAKVDSLWSPAHISHSATQSPQVSNGIVGAKEADVLKIEALESEHKAIKQEVDGLQSKFELFKESTTDTTSNHETFIDSLRQRFDNLTTDHMVRNIIYHMQLLWPNHPANVLNQLTHLHQRQTQTEHQLRDVVTLTEAQRRQIDSRTTELANLLEQARKEFQQRIAEQQIFHRQANEDFQQRNTEQLNFIEQAKADSQQRDEENLSQIQNAVNDFQRQHAEQSKLLEESKQEYQQRNKVLAEETQEKHTILEQDIQNHLGRIQNLQKGLQSIRTDHTTSVTDLWKTLKDAQVIIQSLGSTSTTNGNPPTTATNTTDLAPLKSSLETTQKRLDDVWDNFISEMATTSSTLTDVRKNIKALNLHCGIETPTTPPPPFRNVINLEEGEDENDSPSPNLKAPFSPAHQLVIRGGSVSLGESDSEPVPARTRKRRRGRPTSKSSPRGRKSARVS